ncbi:MAG: 50S ribosomal protein L23 [Minisyncoccia bacterium]
MFLVKRPLLTEKATRHQELNKYFFEVLKGANKSEIKKQIERYYRVKVKKVNIIKGKKRKKKWMRIVGREPKYKKAIVTLEEGYKIDIGV